ncbi:MAG: hypothetical protein COX02_00690 [Candidatus Vogelbacteria bacterium CG22_combo_CG10-13_8_21_14_all_37_9]|uniref:Uncharacterized protein n=1 Tax=Candidatus Vogelbacteria bacterium CG22_combo_CG10-13_8_21_14_all_37_9 TaxID=1975046 RepID=A0A2H0BLD4_9BACT|nr:MAG: hypothetical protein COX02_00690 [Candidatus Vogelbacteria bacterium CG22_combo_CG10-13_8_21_14_all_37_9]
MKDEDDFPPFEEKNNILFFPEKNTRQGRKINEDRALTLLVVISIQSEEMGISSQKGYIKVELSELFSQVDLDYLCAQGYLDHYNKQGEDYYKISPKGATWLVEDSSQDPLIKHPPDNIFKFPF